MWGNVHAARIPRTFLASFFRKYGIHLNKPSGQHLLTYIFLQLCSPSSMGHVVLTHPPVERKEDQKKMQ
jgi:hypothetical protein